MPRHVATGNPTEFPGILLFQRLNIADNSAAMNPLLRDFCDHQVWADAEHGRAIGAQPEARDDQAIRNRFHHIAHVQRGFLWTVVGDTSPFAFTKPEDFPSFEDLRRYSREYHDDMRAFLAAVSAARLEEPVTIQWFKDPPLTITVTEALTQCAMHSHYHRGQNATRLRELGGEPPMTDLIVWYWKGRPLPVW
jgi:uncharacterized damage-inducible protein DinB